jgi:uncharacterized protein YndB with AHSA1/START domain
MSTEVVHSSFSIERNYAASPARVFNAFADEATKRRWFAEGKDFAVDGFSADFRVGGQEKSRFRFSGGGEGAPPKGTPLGNDTTYLDIVPNERIVFAYSMFVGDYRMSVSLATVQFFPAGKGTRLVFTEQAAFFERSDGAQLREEGWRQLFARIEGVVGPT